MAGARIVLGGELDIASGREVSDAKDEILGVLRHKPDEKPIWRKAQAAGTIAASPVVIPLVPDGPASGRTWNITQLIALGSDDHTTLTGVSVSWYVGDPANPDLTGVIYPAMPVTGQATFSKSVLWNHSQESLFGIVYGGTVGQGVLLIARMGEYVDDAIEARGIYGRNGA